MKANQKASEIQGVSRQYIGFMLGTEEFCAPIAMVKEILEIPPITYLPNAPEYMEGVMNLRGQIVPIIDLKKRLHLGKTIDSPKNRVIAFQIKMRIVGCVVDSVSQVFGILDEQIEPPMEMFLSESSKKYIIGVSKLEGRLPVILNIEKILTTSKSAYADRRKQLL